LPELSCHCMRSSCAPFLMLSEAELYDLAYESSVEPATPLPYC
jgi:hypothetical protein